MLTSSDIFFELESPTLVSYLLFNITYNISNYYRKILLCDLAIGQHTALS